VLVTALGSCGIPVPRGNVLNYYELKVEIKHLTKNRGVLLLVIYRLPPDPVAGQNTTYVSMVYSYN
jgi:hypothetical protein